MLEQIKNKLDGLWQIVDENIHVQELTSLDVLVSGIISNLSKTYFVDKLNSEEWPDAVDKMLICDSSLEDDKIARSTAIYSLFVADRAKDSISNNKVLDFGCGEGYVVKCAADSGVGLCVGYDIVEQNWSRWNLDNHFLTTDFERVRENGPYDIVLLFDVLDHVLDRPQVDVLKDAKSVLKNDGKLVIRCHPWCSRHGTHLWKLNKAHAHLVFTEEELVNMGHIGLPTFKVTHPRDTYTKWFADAGFRIIFENPITELNRQFFEKNALLRSKVLEHYQGENCYTFIEDSFIDFILEPRFEPSLWAVNHARMGKQDTGIIKDLGLVSAWLFNEDGVAFDPIANLTGNLNGGVSYVNHGRGTCVSFNRGAGGYITANNPCVDLGGNTPKSIGVWLMPISVWGGGNRIAVTLGGAVRDSNVFLIGIHSATSAWFVSTGGITNDLTFGISSANEWVHLVGTYSNGNETMYLNGIQVAAKNINSTNTGTGALCFGADGAGAEHWDGLIGSVLISSKCWTSDQALRLYQEPFFWEKS